MAEVNLTKTIVSIYETTTMNSSVHLIYANKMFKIKNPIKHFLLLKKKAPPLRKKLTWFWM
jgi:hypothetical protein